MIALYVLIVIMCVGFILAALHDNKLLDSVPWIITLVITMIQLDSEVKKDKKEEL